ncbi:MAG: transporter [Eubacterium sp.]|nr:transporter [Eubacterium sp.]
MKDKKKYAILFFSFLIYSVSSVCAKLAAKQDVLSGTVLFLMLEMVCLGIYALVWQQILKKFALVTAIAGKGSVVIFNLVWSVWIFKETVTFSNLIGAAIIIVGICVVAADS